MRGLIFTPAAIADVEAIWDYTAARWNAEQADRHADLIENARSSLAEGRKRGSPATVYYRIEGMDLLVVRILHGRMDAERHLR